MLARAFQRISTVVAACTTKVREIVRKDLLVPSLTVRLLDVAAAVDEAWDVRSIELVENLDHLPFGVFLLRSRVCRVWRALAHQV